MFNKNGIRKVLKGLSINLATAAIIGMWVRHTLDTELTGCYALLLLACIFAMLATVKGDNA